MLAFLPWAETSESLRCGDFHVVAFGTAMMDGSIEVELQDAISTILLGYGHKRQVDRNRVSLIRRDDLSFTSNLDDEMIASYYDFRFRLTFSALSYRRFFDSRYCCSDSFRLDIRSFDQTSTGAVSVQSRRRDGFQNIVYTAGAYNERMPEHVSACDISRNVDFGVLSSLQLVAMREDDLASRVADSLRLFVRANSDNSSVDAQSELIDTVSAFSRLVNEWKAEATVDGFHALLPSGLSQGVGDLEQVYDTSTCKGERLADARINQSLLNGASLRQIWLRDAFSLRHQFGHGHVLTSRYPSSWSLSEHLLLAAWIFPVVVKALLVANGLYSFSSQDRFRNWSFDSLLLLEPFAGLAPQDSSEEPRPCWQAEMSNLEWRFAAEELVQLYRDRERSETETQGNN